MQPRQRLEWRGVRTPRAHTRDPRRRHSRDWAHAGATRACRATLAGDAGQSYRSEHRDSLARPRLPSLSRRSVRIPGGRRAAARNATWIRRQNSLDQSRRGPLCLAARISARTRGRSSLQSFGFYRCGARAGHSRRALHAHWHGSATHRHRCRSTDRFANSGNPVNLSQCRGSASACPTSPASPRTARDPPHPPPPPLPPPATTPDTAPAPPAHPPTR